MEEHNAQINRPSCREIEIGMWKEEGGRHRDVTRTCVHGALGFSPRGLLSHGRQS